MREMFHYLSIICLIVLLVLKIIEIKDKTL